MSSPSPCEPNPRNQLSEQARRQRAGQRGLSDSLNFANGAKRSFEWTQLSRDFAKTRPQMPSWPAILHQDPPTMQAEEARTSGLWPYLQSRISAIFAPQLSVRQRLRKVPLVGYLMGLTAALIKLPAMRHRQTLEFDLLMRQNQQLVWQIQALQQSISEVVNENVRSHHAMSNLIQKKLRQQDAQIQKIEALDAGRRLMRIEEQYLDRRLHQLSNLLVTQQQEYRTLLNRLAFEGDSDASSVSTTGAPPTTASVENEDLAQFYLNFENRFRGPRTEILRRLRVYEPLLVELKAKVSSVQGQQFIDVGCGRGEWLQLLTELNIPALGIDMNHSMVDACLQQGLAAQVGDAIAYMNAQNADSLIGVSGFHIIEHLPFEKLIALFDAAYRALQPGGMLVFETPNPENLIVGACNFHYDPTHLKPIPPDVAQFIAEQRGFSRVEILRLHPFPDDYQMPTDTESGVALNKFLFSAQDYAVLAWK